MSCVKMGSKIVIVVLVGLPGAGKTSFCDQLKRCLREKVNFYHLCFDLLFEIQRNVREFKTLRRKFVELTRILVKSIKFEDFEPVESHLKQHLDANLSKIIENYDKNHQISYIIIDDNNFYRSMRYNFYQIAREFACSFCQIYFEVPLEVAIQRDLARKTSVGAEIIQKMSEQLEIPINSNSWERNSLFTDVETADFNEIFDFIEKLLPEEPLKEAPAPATQTEIHKIDLILRKLVSKKVQEASNKAKTAEILQEKRKRILEDIRNGVICTKNVVFEDILLETGTK
ncbi:L-seryl-tRNA(Sec) kinase [Culicoides brevitarsis]|uniref:L-seryl-tRNA(Sec) kinase n=1 Tax=Culicoides brevitarsis TaxID=469753 RepID=UPI00307BAAF7